MRRKKVESSAGMIPFMQALEVAVARIRAGDFAHRVPVDADGAMGPLGEQFNMMVAELQERVVRFEREIEARGRQLEEALEQQTATGEILQVISGSPTDVGPVFAVVLASAARLCDASDATLFRVEGDGLRLVAHEGPIPAHAPGEFPLTRGTPPGRVVLDRRAVHVADLQAEVDEFPEGSAFARLLRFRTILGVPLLHGAEAIGAITVRRTDRRSFTDRQADLLKTFADQAVIAIENVRLFKELQARNAELTEALEQQTATSEILRAISRAQTDVQPVFEVIASSALRLCDGVASFVFRYDGKLIHLATFNSAEGVDLQPPGKFFPAPPEHVTFAGRAVATARLQYIADIEHDRDAPPGLVEFARANGFLSIVAAPMVRNGHAIGAIAVTHRDVNGFTPKQCALLETFADQAVIAIENVRLFKELEARTRDLTRSVEELRALGEVSRAVSATLDVETVLQTVVSRASQLAGADGCSILEYDEATEEFRLRATHNYEAELVALLRATPLRRWEGLVGRATERREPMQVPDIADEGEYKGRLRDVLLRMGWRALLAVPLVREDHIIGALSVTRKVPGEFPPDVIELLRTFATQSAVAIQNARLFREIDAKSRELEIASRHKSQFLANMSHELRTPLNAILGYTELILDGIYGDVPEKIGDVLQRLGKSGQHLLGLINDVLDLSKIEAGQLTLSLHDYSMQEVVQVVAAAMGSLAEGKNLALRISVPPNLPTGRGDERRITQVLMNLVGNAIKFTDAGEVRIEAKTSDGEFVVSVADTGPGIAEADQQRIFEEFQQVDSLATRTKGGTGLGLAIGRRIVKMHGGRIGVESTLGRGSTFWFTLPVRVDPPTEGA